MSETELNVDHKKTLRWFFKQDPRLQGVKTPVGFRVVTLRIADFPYFLCSRDGTLISIILKAQFRDAAECGVPQMEVNQFELQLPRCRGVKRRYIYMEYDLSNTELAIPGSDLYAIVNCRPQPLTLGYV